MTILVAAKLDSSIIIGCDSLVSFGNSRVDPFKFSKLIKFDNFIIGGCGINTIFHLVRKNIEKNQPAPSNPDQVFELTRPIFKEYAELVKEMLIYDEEGDNSSGLLLVTSDKIFSCDESSAEEYHKYVALGSGQNFALGSLHSCYPDENCVEKALKAACSLALDCGGKLIIERL